MSRPKNTLRVNKDRLKVLTREQLTEVGGAADDSSGHWSGNRELSFGAGFRHDLRDFRRPAGGGGGSRRR